MSTLYNFNSGPSTLPAEVLKEAADAVINFNNTGLSILEIGHRTHLFQEVMDEAMALSKELMGLSSDFEVMFIQGGASSQFYQIPMNLLPANGRAGYLDCGTWGTKAIKEAQHFGEVVVLASSADKQYTYIPKDFNVPADLSYLHITSNNTIEGTQMHRWPQTNLPIICDMSSDILSRELDFNRFALVYAGAQKNMGAAGVTFVAINKSLLGSGGRSLPTMLDYANQIAQGSMVNTPPVFAIYVCLLTLRWLKAQGGIPAIAPLNRMKAQMLYDTIDRLPIFVPKVAAEDRSDMNLVWVMKNKALEPAFLNKCREAGLVALEGHRTAGGFRASLYNAMPLQGVKLLTQVMEDFAQRNG